MRFWQKIFILTLTILLISLNIFTYISIQNSLNMALDKEVYRRLDEYELICTSLQTNLVYQKYILEKSTLTEQEILKVFDDFSKTYTSNILIFEKTDIQSNSTANASIKKENESDILYITGVFPFEKTFFEFTTKTDITGIFKDAEQQINYSQSLSLVVSLVTAVIILIMSLILTYRINALRRSTRKMSHGIFFMRAKVKSKDEIGELAEDFNTMAETVEDKVSELSQIAEDRKRFIDNIAHEMKTPLTSIIGFADLLKSAKLDNKTKVEYADNIYKEGKHLKNVSSKLMELILMGKTNPSRQDVEIFGFLDEIYSTMEHICSNAGLVLVLHKSEENYILNIDTELMKSLLYNLIDNAVKASEKHKESRIFLSACKDCISVKDFGRGIPKEEINKITEPFYMLDKARTRKHGGAGLGLALCAEIAGLHGAKLEIDSVLGEYTEIKIVFNFEG